MNKNGLEIIVETRELVHVLTFANSVVEKRHVIAELGNVKLATVDNSLEIAATDMDLYLSQNIGAQVLSSGVTTVSTRVLTDIIRKIPDKEITIKQTSDGNQLELIGKNCFFSLPTLPASQFPEMDTIKAEIVLTIPCSSLVRLIDCTQFAMSTEETRYNLNGIYLHVKENHLCAAATDGHRLSVVSVEIGAVVQEFGIILPRKTVHELLKLIKDPRYANADIEISLAINKVKFVCNNVIIVSKLIDGQFPEYSAFIPTESNHKLTVNPKELANIIDRVATVTIDKFRAIKITLTDAFMQVTASGEARGVAKEQLAYSEILENYCVFEGNSGITIGFNPKYLSDVLNIIKCDQVELHFKDSFSPALIKVLENPTDYFVIMPVKV
ncbi:DNA polymerase III subunit beta [Candidatus Trichorickettsia mobilis]|uniref:DNA polymerase III subunit beta n=1 Tax=Candidatus Trichorickettsia mobilis TaxID=1346319 RepID=UPI00292F3C4E|nr:DNA polymerase III subunit beta [Candidatus Trichorickettsia mobilis]